jgi:UDP-N-acetylglucosamine transferase subunit ALG13
LQRLPESMVSVLISTFDEPREITSHGGVNGVLDMESSRDMLIMCICKASREFDRHQVEVILHTPDVGDRRVKSASIHELLYIVS